MIIAADGFNKRFLRFGKIIPAGRYYIKLTNGQRMHDFIVAHIVVVVEYHPIADERRTKAGTDQ